MASITPCTPRMRSAAWGGCGGIGNRSFASQRLFLTRPVGQMEPGESSIHAARAPIFDALTSGMAYIPF